MQNIIQNMAKCRLCGDIIESTYTHDIKSCRCGEITVDGGLSYIRRGWRKDRLNISELSIYEDDDEEKI